MVISIHDETKGRSPVKKTVKKGDSSFLKPKFTEFSNHSEMDFRHHNMSRESHLRTFVGNQTTNVPFWPV